MRFKQKLWQLSFFSPQLNHFEYFNGQCFWMLTIITVTVWFITWFTWQLNHPHTFFVINLYTAHLNWSKTEVPTVSTAQWIPDDRQSVLQARETSVWPICTGRVHPVYKQRPHEATSSRGASWMFLHKTQWFCDSLRDWRLWRSPGFLQL